MPSPCHATAAHFVTVLDAALPEKFVRQPRKITPARLVAFLCIMSGFGSKGYRRVVQELRSGLHRAFGWHSADDVPTPQAFAQARHGLSRETCRRAFTAVRNACQNHLQPAARTYAGLRIVAIDGTRLTLPPTPTLIEQFGLPRNQRGAASAPMAGLIQLWDVGSNLPIDFALAPCDFSERGYALELFDQLGRRDLLIGDRGYPSFEIFRALCRRRCRFLLRCRQRHGKEVEQFVASGANDAIVCFIARNDRGQRIAGTPRIPVRLVRIPLPDGRDEILATNLWLTRGHSREALAELYTKRWTIETAFREMKAFHALEDFSAGTPDGIYQEIVAIQIFLLLTAELEAMAKQHKPAADEPGAQPFSFNRLMIGDAVIILMRTAATNPEQLPDQLRIQLAEIWKARSKPRPGRSYPRVRKRPLRGYKPSGG